MWALERGCVYISETRGSRSWSITFFFSSFSQVCYCPTPFPLTIRFFSSPTKVNSSSTILLFILALITSFQTRNEYERYSHTHTPLCSSRMKRKCAWIVSSTKLILFDRLISWYRLRIHSLNCETCHKSTRVATFETTHRQSVNRCAASRELF